MEAIISYSSFVYMHTLKPGLQISFRVYKYIRMQIYNPTTISVAFICQFMFEMRGPLLSNSWRTANDHKC